MEPINDLHKMDEPQRDVAVSLQSQAKYAIRYWLTKRSHVDARGMFVPRNI